MYTKSEGKPKNLKLYDGLFSCHFANTGCPFPQARFNGACYQTPKKM